jgi:uncharacterized membrane protein HdeD (DUF308 family)
MEDAMAAEDAVPLSGTRSPVRPPGWVRLLLGIVMILAGVAVLTDVAFASLVSSTFIGATAIVVGTFEIVHAVWTRGWGGLPWQMLLGLLYIVLGLVLVGVAGSSVMVLTYVLVRSAGQGELLLTYGLGLVLLLSGIVRILLGLSRWRESGWVMLFAGVFGVVAGLIVLAEFPKTGFWIFGLLLGVDLIVHGAAWLGFAILPRRRTS